MGVFSYSHWVILLAALAFWVVPVFPLWRAYEKAELNPGLSLLWLVPTVGPIIALFVLAYSRWPLEKYHPR